MYQQNVFTRLRIEEAPKSWGWDPCEPLRSSESAGLKRRRREKNQLPSFFVMTTLVLVLVATLATEARAFVPVSHHQRLQPRLVLRAATSTREATSLPAASRKSKSKSSKKLQGVPAEQSEEEDAAKSRRRPSVETFRLDMLGDRGETAAAASRTRSKYRPAGATGVRAAMTRKTRRDYEAEISASQIDKLARRLATNENLDLSSLPPSVLSALKGQGAAGIAFTDTKTYSQREARVKEERASKKLKKSKSSVDKHEDGVDSSDSGMAASIETDFVISTSGMEIELKRSRKGVSMLRRMDEKTWARYKRTIRATDRKRLSASEFDLYAYYKSELLTAQEEYELGMKVQFLAGCEDVHEGLCLALSRLPTLDEWAVACGFNETDTNYVTTEADQSLRPAGWEDRFKVVDPTWFEGRGRVADLGVGRGNGNKKAPLTALPDYYDDSANRFRKPGCPEVSDGPINRGSTKRLLELLREAREAKETMIRCNMRLVVSIAKKFTKGSVSVADLVQEGSIGLAKATMKFQPRKGFRFSTYASWWIQQAVYNSINKDSRIIRLPAHIHNALNRIRKVKKQLHELHGRKPTNAELAAELKMTEERFVEMMKRTRRCISLDAPRWKDSKNLEGESSTTVGDVIACEEHSAASTVRKIDRDIFMEDLKEMMKELTPEERAVIGARYGLFTGTARSVTAVAALMKRTNSWVRQQETKGLRKLRRPWYEKRLKEHQAAIGR